jgi:hypothetical protein
MGAVVAVIVALATHPLHTTLTQVAYRDLDRTLELSVRAFADDFRAALKADVTDSSAAAYLRSTVTVFDRSGRALPMTWCGLRRVGDAFLFCLRASVPPPQGPNGLQGLRVHVSILFDRYSDQINIVQASVGGRRTALLFLSGDQPKPLL